VLREKKRLLCLIAVDLKRDTRAVGRDVDLLERFVTTDPVREEPGTWKTENR
jgi:hypothetical protein